MATNDVLTLLALLFTFGSGLLGVVKWVIANHDKINKHIHDKTDELDKRMDNRSIDIQGAFQINHRDVCESIGVVRKSVDSVKDKYVKRDELDRDLVAISNTLTNIEAAQRDNIKEIHHKIDDQTKEMNSRLDRLLEILATRED